MSSSCAICDLYGRPRRLTSSSLMVETGSVALLGHAAEEPERVSIPVCPEHAVDVYRGRVTGVAMSWRVLQPPVLPARAG